MGFYAQHDNSSGAVGQKEMAERRRVDEMLKQIEHCHANMMSSLSTWQRHHVAGSAKTARQALEGVMAARETQNRLLREFLGIEEDRLAIGKR